MMVNGIAWANSPNMAANMAIALPPLVCGYLPPYPTLVNVTVVWQQRGRRGKEVFSVRTTRTKQHEQNNTNNNNTNNNNTNNNNTNNTNNNNAPMINQKASAMS